MSNQQTLQQIIADYKNNLANPNTKLTALKLFRPSLINILNYDLNTDQIVIEGEVWGEDDLIESLMQQELKASKDWIQTVLVEAKEEATKKLVRELINQPPSTESTPILDTWQQLIEPIGKFKSRYFGFLYSIKLNIQAKLEGRPGIRCGKMLYNYSLQDGSGKDGLIETTGEWLGEWFCNPLRSDWAEPFSQLEIMDAVLSHLEEMQYMVAKEYGWLQSALTKKKPKCRRKHKTDKRSKSWATFAGSSNLFPGTNWSGGASTGMARRITPLKFPEQPLFPDPGEGLPGYIHKFPEEFRTKDAFFTQLKKEIKIAFTQATEADYEEFCRDKRSELGIVAGSQSILESHFEYLPGSNMPAKDIPKGTELIEALQLCGYEGKLDKDALKAFCTKIWPEFDLVSDHNGNKNRFPIYLKKPLNKPMKCGTYPTVLNAEVGRHPDSYNVMEGSTVEN